MISDAEIRRLAELYEAAADTLDPLNPDMENRRKAFDFEVEKLFARESPASVKLSKFRNQAVRLCIKYLRRDLSEAQRRARDTTIRDPSEGDSSP